MHNKFSRHKCVSMRRHGDTSELWSDYMSLTIFLYSVLGSLLANYIYEKSSKRSSAHDNEFTYDE